MAGTPAWVPLAMVALLYLGLAPARGLLTPRWRIALSAVAIVLSVRYAVWRVGVMWDSPVRSTAELCWQWVFLVAELSLLVEGGVFLLMMSRRRDRHREADANAAWYAGELARDGGASLPTIDVLIPTYNEEWDVLSRTLVGALALDYPHVQVHVLDDGARDWLVEKCAEWGVAYHRRPDRAHAKAGNINHALTRTSSELVLVFDADFVAQRDFLQRTVGFFRDPTVGLVQIPHHFFNDDPVQANLRIFGEHADDQTFFFSDVMVARDAWGVAFSCGSNSLARRSALEALGGIPTSSITEDILTSVALLQRGWKTVYLNERLARGLAPEGLSALYTQRARWARGGIQLLFVPEGPLRARGLSLLARLFFLPFSWVASNLALPVMIAGPITFLWFGLVAVPTADGNALLRFQVPMLLATLVATRRLATVQRSTVLSLAHSVFATFRLAPAVAHSLIKPFAVGFKVTPKGKLATGMVVDVRAVVISGGTILALLLGMLLNGLPDYERLPPDAFLTPSLLWGSMTVLVMVVCLMMAFEFRPTREQERFHVNEDHAATLATDRGTAALGRRVRVVDMSANGAALQWGVARPGVGERLALHLSDVGTIDAVVRRWIGEVGIGVGFEGLSPEIERYLIAKLFAHSYETHAAPPSIAAGWTRVVSRLLGGSRRRSGPPAWSLGALPLSPPVRGVRPDLRQRPALAYPRLAPPERRAA